MTSRRRSIRVPSALATAALVLLTSAARGDDAVPPPKAPAVPAAPAPVPPVNAVRRPDVDPPPPPPAGPETPPSPTTPPPSPEGPPLPVMPPDASVPDAPPPPPNAPPPSTGLAPVPEAPPPPPEAGTPKQAPVEPGAARGLVSVPAEVVEDRPSAAGYTPGAWVNVATPQYEPTGRFLIPWTGQADPCDRGLGFFAAETLTYDSNIFASERDVQDDWISSTTIGVHGDRAGAAFWARGVGTLTYAHYFDHPDESSWNGYLDLEGGWRGGCLYAGLENRLAYLQNPIVVRDDVFLLVDQELNSYWQDTLRAYVGWEGPRARLEADYRFDLFDSTEGVAQAYDHTDHAFGLRGDYFVSDKTTVGGYAGARFVPYRDATQRDFSVYGVGGTFSWRPTAKFGVAGRLGVAALDSDGGDDVTELTGSLDAVYDPTSCTTAVFGWSRTFEPSLGADAQTVDLLRVRVQSNVAAVWIVWASTGVQLSDVLDPTPDGARDAALWFLDLGLHRDLGRHVGLDLGYQFRSQDAEGSGIDFDQHRLTVGASFTF